MAKATGRKAHELTHFIKDWSSVKYRALADTLVKQYQKQGVSVSELVDNQTAKAKQNGRELSRQEAFDEVVADSMESMLTDENTNSRMGAVIGDIVQNAVPINGRKDTADNVLGTYSMACYATDSRGREFVGIVTVEEHTGKVESLEYYDVAHAVSGRQKKGSQADTKSQGVDPIKAATISIEDFLGIVKSTHQSILSKSVLDHYGETRNPKGHYADSVLFSDRDPTAEATRAALEKENGKLREDVSRLRELLRLQGKVTGGTVPKQSSVEAAAKWLNKYAGAKADVKELSGMLTDFYKFLATDKDYSWDDVHQRAMVIARHLQDNVQIKQQISDYARDVLREVRGTKITLGESQRAEVERMYGSYEAFRKAAFGTVTFVKEGGIPLDSQWQESSTMFPGTFDSEITASDQPRALMDAINALRNSDTTVMEYAYNRERN